MAEEEERRRRRGKGQGKEYSEEKEMNRGGGEEKETRALERITRERTGRGGVGERQEEVARKRSREGKKGRDERTGEELGGDESERWGQMENSLSSTWLQWSHGY